MPINRRMPRATDAIRLEQRRQRYAPPGPCEECGSNEDLVWDHRDPMSKFRDIGRMIQSYPDAIIQREIAKCRVLCRTCNTKKGRISNRVPAESVREVKRLISQGYSDPDIAEMTGVGRGTVWRIRNGESWTDVQA